VASNMAGDGRGPGGYLDADRTPRPGNPPQPHVTGGAGPGGHVTGGAGPGGHVTGGAGPDIAALREEIRRVVIEELAQFAGGSRG